jgi:hypothetical protein
VVIVAAACTAPRARLAGTALTVALVGTFAWASVRIGNHSQYQRPDWRGVVSALGHPARARAIFVYPGSLGAGPLSWYLSGVPWAGNETIAAPTGHSPVSVSEVDLVGNSAETPMATPAGMHLISRRAVGGFLVERYSLAAPLRSVPGAIPARVGALLTPAPPSPVVLVQPRA